MPNTPSPFSPVVNPAALLAQAHAAPFAAYRAGDALNVCRNSTPHNWWLSPVDAPASIGYNWPQGHRPQSAFFEFGTLVHESDETVSYGSARLGKHRGDQGLAVSSVWRFDEQKLIAARARWDEAVRCAKTFNQLAGTRRLDFRALSEKGRELARQVKRLYQPVPGVEREYWHLYATLSSEVAMRPELREDIEQLCAMGLVEVLPEGYLRARPPLADAAVPRKARPACLEDLQPATRAALARAATSLSDAHPSFRPFRLHGAIDKRCAGDTITYGCTLRSSETSTQYRLLASIEEKYLGRPKGVDAWSHTMSLTLDDGKGQRIALQELSGIGAREEREAVIQDLKKRISAIRSVDLGGRWLA